MSKLDDRPNSSPRGRRRREQLVDAGVELLADGGWPAVTTRAVADRAGANLGLIHYHWGGLSQLKLAIARRAGETVFRPPTLRLLESDSVEDILAQLPALVAPPADAKAARLSIELFAGAARDPDLGEVLRESLAEVRSQLAAWLDRHVPHAPAGTATLLVALIDGLFLHRVLDPGLRADEALDTLASFVTDAPWTPDG